MIPLVIPDVKQSYKWTFDELLSEARKYSTREEFQRLSYSAYRVALRTGALDSICQHMEKGNRKPRERVSFTLDELIVIASLYSSKNEFRLENGRAYNFARKNNMLEALCGHMMPKKRSHWTNESLRHEASKYRTKADFKRNCTAGFFKAKRLGILEDICAHMERGSRDDDAVYVWRPKDLAYYKIGLTSARLGLERIQKVANRLGVELELILLSSIICNPYQLEAELLSFGIPVSFSSKFNGYSEFRWLGDEELSSIVEKIISVTWIPIEEKRHDK